MKIYVYFKKYLLGYLTYENNYFLYNSNELGENNFLKNCYAKPFYPLLKSRKKKLKELPNFLQDFEEMIKDEFFIGKAQIKKNDSKFQKLYKLSNLPLDYTGFYITNKMREENE